MMILKPMSHVDHGPCSFAQDGFATDACTHVNAIHDGDSGCIHSCAIGSAVDEPGPRFVVRTTDCSLGHSTHPNSEQCCTEQRYSSDEVMAEIGKYERFLRMSNGGVTISGGEPLVQAAFVSTIFQACKRRKLHTALETNGYLGARLSDADLAAIDLVLLHIELWDQATHRRLTGRDVTPVLQFARRLADLCKPVWVRFIMPPEPSDDLAHIAGLADFVMTLHNLERLEVLSFDQIGTFKCQQPGSAYALEQAAPPDPAFVETVRRAVRLDDHGLAAKRR